MNAGKLIVVLTFVACTLGALYMVSSGSDRSGPPPAGPGFQEPAERTRIEPAQGITGTLLDPTNRPVAGVTVYLMEGSVRDIFRRVQALNDGVVFPPATTDVTNTEGRFRLGLAAPVPGTTFEVRAVTDRFADLRIPSLMIHEDDWYDLGRVRFEEGITVHGRVTVQGSETPVPGATIQIHEVGTVMQIAPTPGREDGLKVEADETGYFEVQNAPNGIVDIRAAAPRFAPTYRRQIALNPDVANELNFALSPGSAVAGLVAGPYGVPIGGASVIATSLRRRQPQTEETRTAGDGRFEFQSLVDASFQLSASAPGFQRRDEKPVRAGSEDVRLVLEYQETARVRVHGGGDLLTSYRLDVKSHFAVQDQIGNVHHQAPREIRPVDLTDGFALVEGLDPGTYVFQVEHRDHAKTFSEPFTVGPGIPRPDVEVRMSTGGGLIGTVSGPDGAPLEGVVVQTQVNGTVENPFRDMLSGIVPKKITVTSVQTDGQGRYRFDLLAKGTYQLEFVHPEYCEGVLMDLRVDEGRSTSAPDISLTIGALITGKTSFDGAPAGQVKVSVRLPSRSRSESAELYVAEAVTNSRGEYLLPKRLPPGTYEIRASRHWDEPFKMMQDYGKTIRTIAVSEGQQDLQVDFDVPRR